MSRENNNNVRLNSRYYIPVLCELSGMENNYPENWPQFFTATIADWKHLLKEEEYKTIITDSLKFLVDTSKVRIQGFVIMSNHIHLIWQALYGYHLKAIQGSFLKFTSKKFLSKLALENRLKEYEVNTSDKKHNFWKRDSLGIELFTPEVFYQKLAYCHYNPVRAGICNFPEEYHFSSALFYEKGIDHFNMLSHFMG